MPAGPSSAPSMRYNPKEKMSASEASHPIQEFVAGHTPWHITFGTYGARLHGDDRHTVDKTHNQLGSEFVHANEAREASSRGRMKFPPRYLSQEQRRFIESILPEIVLRGGWRLRMCAAGPDHVHVLLDVESSIHGEAVRRLIKRWLGQELTRRWALPPKASWWAEEGSNKAIHDSTYLQNAYRYVFDQRAT